MLSRRRLITWGLAAGTAAAGGLLSLEYRRRQRPLHRSELAAHLHEEFDFLRPGHGDVERFLDLYFTHYGPNVRRGGALQHLSRTFLLSTDFFQNGQPASGPVRLVNLYHPYAFPCYNPLRKFDDS